MSKKALLIIDMQRGDFPPAKFRYQADRLIQNIDRIAARFRSQGLPVVYIQHDGSAENVFIPGSEDWKILAGLSPKPEDIVVSKTANNAFYKSSLHDVLQKQAIEEVFISGSATDFCVNATVQAALALDYQITVIADAHTTGNRPNMDATMVIDHYNWVWQNLTPTQGSIVVKGMSELGLSGTSLPSPEDS